MIRVLLVDDQQLVRSGFRLILGSEPDIEVVGECEDGAAAVTDGVRLRPDVVLMDVQMPTMDGLEATRLLTSRSRAKVVVLTTFERDDYIIEALRAGASGFLVKNSPPEELVRAVRVVAGGEAILSPGVTRRILTHYTAQGPANREASAQARARWERLSGREKEVLAELARGRSNAEIAHDLYMGEGTVKTHVSGLLTKLGCRDRVQAVVFAYQNGLVEVDGPR
jgi:DNA-binding NarL/FixJ family response regulator